MATWEAQVETSTAGALAAMLGKLPAAWLAAWRARRLEPSLPEYPGEVEVPDADTIYSWIEGLCATPHRRPGTPHGHRAERWVARQLRALGLEGVTLDPVPLTVWSARRWSLTVDDAAVPCFFVPDSGFTGPRGLGAPLAFVGAGTPRDFARVDVRGRIAVGEVSFPRLPTGLLLRLLGASFALSDPEHQITATSLQTMSFVRQNFLGGTTADSAPRSDVYWEAFRRGARAVCLVLKDQESGSNTHYGPYDGIAKPLPGLWIGKHDGARLARLARAGATAQVVLTGRSPPGVMHNVWGVLPGRSDEVVLVTSHHDSPFAGAIEDGAGVAQVLAQAWAWSRVPAARRPKTLVFVVDAGHFYGSAGAFAFARDHRDLMARARVAITLEHLGAREVRVCDRRYVPTGRLALTAMFTTMAPAVMATVSRALHRHPIPATAPIPADFLARAPTSDAAGYFLEGGVPVISWIGCPDYLLDDGDGLQWVERRALRPIAATVTDMVKTFMAS